VRWIGCKIHVLHAARHCDIDIFQRNLLRCRNDGLSARAADAIDRQRRRRHRQAGMNGGLTGALYEPVHGSAPDIAGNGLANPLAMLGSFGMALRYSFNMGKEADLLDAAIAAVLAKGLRTADIKSEGTKIVSTAEMGEAVVGELEQLAAAKAQ
jgi:hypothetical protein